MPDALLFLICCIAISISDIFSGSFSSSVCFVFHLYVCYQGKYYIQLLSCLEALDSRFATCCLYLHYI